MTTQATTSTANPLRLLRSYLFWTYDRGSDTFFIYLNSRDRLTGRERRLQVKGEHPEYASVRGRVVRGFYYYKRLRVRRGRSA